MVEPDTDTFEDSVASHGPGLMPVHPYLFVVLECDRPVAGGARYALAGVDEVIVGRGSERSATRQIAGGITRLMVRLPARSMSSTHARFLRGDDGWVLEDARSTNGSFVNGVRVERAPLAEGDVIELGHTLFLLRLALPTPLGTAASFHSATTAHTAAGMATLVPTLFVELATLSRARSFPCSCSAIRAPAKRCWRAPFTASRNA